MKDDYKLKRIIKVKNDCMQLFKLNRIVKAKNDCMQLLKRSRVDIIYWNYEIKERMSIIMVVGDQSLSGTIVAKKDVYSQ